MGGVRLRTELDRIPLWTGNHVGIKQLCEYMARYLYLPRLRDEQVLLAAIQDGAASLMWQSDTFAYAEGWDEQRQRYQGLRAAQAIRVVVDDRSLLVKPEAALAQFDKDRQAAEAAERAQGSATRAIPSRQPLAQSLQQAEARQHSKRDNRGQPRHPENCRGSTVPCRWTRSALAGTPPESPRKSSST